MAKKKQNAVMTLAPLTAAAVTTAAGMYPVDVMRALKMSSAGDSGKSVSIGDHYRKFGVKGFVSKGMLPEIAKSSVMRVSKFFFFPIMCDNIWGKDSKKCSPLQKGLAGALATVPEILMISPLEVAKIGMQLDHKNQFNNNSRAFVMHQWKTRGLGGVYVGWAGMQWRQCFWTGTYFATLSFWKGQIEPLGQSIGAPDFATRIAAGFVAGFVATFPNAPGDVVRSVIQKRVFENPSQPAYGISPRGVMEHVQVASEIVAARGIKGLYTGLGFKAVHLGGSGALMAAFIPFFADLMGIEYGGI